MNRKFIYFVILLIVLGSVSYSVFSIYGDELLSNYYLNQAQTSINPNDKVENLKKSINANPQNIDALNDLVDIYIYNMMIDDALDYLDLGIKLNAENVSLYLKKLQLFKSLGEIPKAIAFAEGISDEYVASKVLLGDLSTPVVNLQSGDYYEMISIKVSANQPVYYRINALEFEKYTEEIILTDGFYRITFVSIDDDGKVSKSVTHEYDVEILTAPVIFSSDDIFSTVKNQLDVKGIVAIENLELARVIDLSYETLYDDDITTLVNCKELEELILGDISNVSNLRILSKLPNLRKVTINKGATQSILSQILEIENIESVKILNSDIQSLPVNSSSVKELTLKNCYMNDIFNINSYKSLEYLNLQTNLLSNLTNLGELKNLKTLDLSYNNLVDISEVGLIISLRDINLSNNSIHDVSKLSLLSFVENINISNNVVSSVANFMNLRYLKILNCSNNSVLTLEPLTKNDSLIEIHASFNSITDISYINEFINVNYLDINNNDILNY